MIFLLLYESKVFLHSKCNIPKLFHLTHEWLVSNVNSYSLLRMSNLKERATYPNEYCHIPNLHSHLTQTHTHTHQKSKEETKKCSCCFLEFLLKFKISNGKKITQISNEKEKEKNHNENEENDEERQRGASLNGDMSEHLLLTGSKLLEQHAILSLSGQLNSKNKSEPTEKMSL